MNPLKFVPFEGTLSEIEIFDQELYGHFEDRFVVRTDLTRQHVSFQANKNRPIYRWYKYKEAFSAKLIEHLLSSHRVTSGTILDPFAGSGTAMFAANDMGLDADGIELLAIGQEIIAVKQLMEIDFEVTDYEALLRWRNSRPWQDCSPIVTLPELRITRGAYPTETELSLAVCRRDEDVRSFSVWQGRETPPWK